MAFKGGAHSHGTNPAHLTGKTKSAIKAGQSQYSKHHGSAPPQPQQGTPFTPKQTPPQGCAEPDGDEGGM